MDSCPNPSQAMRRNIPSAPVVSGFPRCTDCHQLGQRERPFCGAERDRGKARCIAMVPEGSFPYTFLPGRAHPCGRHLGAAGVLSTPVEIFLTFNILPYAWPQTLTRLWLPSHSFHKTPQFTYSVTYMGPWMMGSAGKDMESENLFSTLL